MSRIIGIDLGTTNSLAAAVEAGIPMVIADSHARRLTPSVVHFPADGAEPLVGVSAQRMRAVRPLETVYSIKRYMGLSVAEANAAGYKAPYRITGNPNEKVSIEIYGHRWTPAEISAEILKKLGSDVEKSFDEKIDRAVITVPAYFNDAQRAATKHAGELAGFTVERIINEPTAAALAYGLNRLKEKSKIAVYDFGGGTFDLSILELNDGVFQVLATHGNTALGGDDLDREVAAFLTNAIVRAGGPDCDAAPELSARVREAAEHAKIQLSTESLVEIALPFLTPSFSFEYSLSREELERVTRPIVLRTRQHCLQSLADARLAATDLNQVILVGGQTRMPMVRRLVAEWFQCSEFDETRGDIRLGEDFHRAAGPVLNTSQNPDEAVALGAAIQAEILSGGFGGMLLLDVTPLSLGLETFGGLMNVIIPRNSTIPLKAGEVFTSAVDNQHSMLIHVLQGERDRAKDNFSLGKFTVDFESAPRGIARVGVQFEIDANGILHVLTRNLNSGEEKIVDLKSAVDVNDAAVQQMVEESVEHAFDDLTARRWIEAKLSASATAEAASKALAGSAGALAHESEVSIRAALAHLNAELDRSIENPTSDDLARLKNAHTILDHASQPLAELLMDRAVEAMLLRRGIVQATDIQ